MYPRHLSDHSPISFGSKPRTKAKGNSIPAWVAVHPSFAEEVNDALEELKQRFVEENPQELISPMQELDLLKAVVRQATGEIRRAGRSSEANTVRHKLASTLSFIKQIEDGEYRKATELLKKMDGTQCPISEATKGSEAYKQIKDSAVELMRLSVEERIKELKATKDSLPQAIYSIRGGKKILLGS